MAKKSLLVWSFDISRKKIEIDECQPSWMKRERNAVKGVVGQKTRVIIVVVVVFGYWGSKILRNVTTANIEEKRSK